MRFPSGFITLEILRKIGNTNGILYIDAGDKNFKVLKELESFGVKATLSEKPQFYASTHPIILLGKPLKIKSVMLRRGRKLNLFKFAENLVKIGWERRGFAEDTGEFAIRGGILDMVFENLALRIEMFGDEIYDLREFSPYTQTSVGKIDYVVLNFFDEDGKYPQNITLNSKALGSNPPFMGNVRDVKDYVKYMDSQGFRIVYHGSPIRLALFEGLKVVLDRGNLYEGFIDFENKEVHIGEWEIMGAEPVRYKVKISKVALKTPRYLNIGDYVVHEDHGIGIFLGLERKDGVEMMSIQYKDGKVYVPVYKSYKISKYVGPEGYNPEISSLHSNKWKSDKMSAMLEADRIAKEILNIIMSRKTPRGFRYTPVPEEREFKATFLYEETEDQRKAIEEVLSDLESDYVMDRLLVGEVAFGKTEVALRAAFRVLYHGKNVVWLCPSTLLAYQHYKNFKERLNPFGIPVYMVSRLKKEKGNFGLFVGTHALLREGIDNLGLVIVDEEHHFGVLQKEHFKRLYPKVDYLYLTATPIPRTLGMGFEGLIDVSHIRTPPPGRLPVETYIAPWNEEIVKTAIRREIDRDGQVFYVFNRIEGLENIKRIVENLFPGVPMRSLHGRMRKRDIKRIMDEFSENKIKVLISTAIIEAGLDFRNANTLIVDSPEIMGLAQLHQLRGRVGRWTKQSYAYFLYRDLSSENSRKRLEYLLLYSSPGDGYKLALKDLELRGMGELLGIRQHGKVSRIGFKLYLKLIKRALGFDRDYEIKVKDAYIPEDYIYDSDRRVEYYIRLAEAESEYEINTVREEMEDIFGPIPPEVERLLEHHINRVSYSGVI